MVTLASIRQALSDTVAAACPGLHCSAYMLNAINPPQACILPKSLPGSQTFDDGQAIPFDIWIYVGWSDLVRAQRAFDDYLDAAATAIEANPSLGLVGVSAMVIGLSERPMLIGSERDKHFGGAFEVVVMS